MSTYDVFNIQSAKNYALVGLIFYVIGAAGWIAGLFGMRMFMGGFMGTGMMGNYYAPFTLFFPAVFSVISITLSVWSWITLNNINAGKYQDAMTASLILGIFGLVFAWFIGGVFLLLAYGKLSDTLRYQATSSTIPIHSPESNPAIPAISIGRFCSKCGNTISEDSSFCRHCGNRL